MEKIQSAMAAMGLDGDGGGDDGGASPDEGMADTITTLVGNLKGGEALMANTDQFNVDESVAKIRVPYGVYTG